MERTFVTEEVHANQVVEATLSAGLEAGEYLVEVKAIDEFGVESEPVTIRVKVKEAPKVTVLAPEDGSIISGNPTIVLRADDSTDCKVRFLITFKPIEKAATNEETPEEKEEKSGEFFREKEATE